MYVTVRRYEGVTNPSEVGCQVRETFLPLISEIPGFVAYYLVDAGGGVLISNGVFQDKAASEESNRRAAEWIRESRGSLLPNPPQVTAGEVVARKSTYEGDGSQEVPKRLTNRCLSTRSDSRRGRCESDRGAPIGLTIAKGSAADVLFPSELEEQTDKHTGTAIDLFRSGGV